MKKNTKKNVLFINSLSVICNKKTKKLTASVQWNKEKEKYGKGSYGDRANWKKGNGEKVM